MLFTKDFIKRWFAKKDVLAQHCVQHCFVGQDSDKQYLANWPLSNKATTIMISTNHISTNKTLSNKMSSHRLWFRPDVMKTQKCQSCYQTDTALTKVLEILVSSSPSLTLLCVRMPSMMLCTFFTESGTCAQTMPVPACSASSSSSSSPCV